MTRTHQDEHVSALLAGPVERLVDRVTDVLERQIELFEELHAMGHEQAALIEERRTEELLALLSRRGRVIARLERVGAELGPFRVRWTEVIARLDTATAQRVQSMLEGLEQLAKRVADRDDRDRQRLEQERDGAAKELASIKQGGTAVAAYTARASTAEPRYHDREG